MISSTSIAIQKLMYMVHPYFFQLVQPKAEETLSNLNDWKNPTFLHVLMLRVILQIQLHQAYKVIKLNFISPGDVR